ncbi:MAG TPA: 4Fe-4S dicluster domain-containing protein [Euryarchaeota archaeon]|nr:ferredoxin-2 [archaeon BMS3Bbin15]HDL16063.1 4Fe-4S dicluster domain-containing protein [Euryarchaeota archaeon]
MVSIKIDLDACIGCGSCVDVCPAGVYELNDDNKSEAVNMDDCIECCACIEGCPQSAISHDSC